MRIAALIGIVCVLALPLGARVNPAATLTVATIGQVAPVPVSSTSFVQWTEPTLNADGTALDDLEGYILGLSGITEDLREQETLIDAAVEIPVESIADLGGNCTDGVCEIPIATLVEGFPLGQYSLWIRAYDTSQNLSVWGDPLAVELVEPDVVAPDAPTALNALKKRIGPEWEIVEAVLRPRDSQ